MERWGRHQSIWSAGVSERSVEALRRETHVETVVVGSGITGLIAALKLQAAGHEVIVVTDAQVGGGTTGASTGHLTQIPDGEFKALVRQHGEGVVKCVLQATGEMIDLLEDFSRTIPCGFLRLQGYKYSENLAHHHSLCEESQLAANLGAAAYFSPEKALPFAAPGCLVVKNQAQLDPLALVRGLASEFITKGGKIIENTHVQKIEDGNPARLTTESGELQAKNVILATHTAVGLYMSLHTRVAPYFSYVMGVRLANPPPPGLYWDDAQPYNYLRCISPEDNRWVVGGRDHKTGQVAHPLEKYLELENYLRERFEVEAVDFYWGNELYESVDHLPYIGKIPFTQSLYTGTGYGGTGLTYGALAGTLLADQLLGQKNHYAEIFDPKRVKPVASASSFLKENMNVAKWMVGDFLSHPDLAEVQNVMAGEGKIIEIDHHKVAVFRDEYERLHTMSPHCTHLGCSVNWNSAEKTWDCPCHGGRFNCTGEPLAGPVLKGLEPVTLEAGHLQVAEKENFSTSAHFSPAECPT